MHLQVKRYFKKVCFQTLLKHRHAVRAEPMMFLTREFGLRSERVVNGVDGL